MSLFLIVSPAVFFFFLCSTAYASETKDSLKLFLQGLAASCLAFLMLYLTRNAFPDRPGNALSFFHHWFHEYFWYLLVGSGAFWLVPSYRESYADRPRRIASFLLGVFAPSGFATIVTVGYLRDPYYVFMLPLLRISIAILMSRLLDRAIGEFGIKLGLLIAAAACLSALPALVPFFHFWNLGLLAFLAFAGILGACAYFCRDALFSIFHRELWEFREGKRDKS